MKLWNVAWLDEENPTTLLKEGTLDELIAHADTVEADGIKNGQRILAITKDNITLTTFVTPDDSVSWDWYRNWEGDHP